MGTRHQVFIIARVNGKYRIVAVFHDQKCETFVAAQMAVYFLKEIKACSLLISRELECLRDPSFAPDGTLYPCPYLYKVGVVAMGKHITWTKDSWRRIDPVIYYPRQKDNDSGITVIDATNPEDPSFCFIDPGGSTRFPMYVPIRPRDYVLNFFYGDDPDADNSEDYLDMATHEAISELERTRFIPRSVLLAAFADHRGRSHSPLACSIEQVPRSRDNANGEPTSLALISFRNVLEVAVESGDEADFEFAASIPLTPEMATDALEALQKLGAPDACKPLLVEALLVALKSSEVKELDLRHSQLSTTSLNAVIDAISGLTIECLDLSGNPNLNATVIRQAMIAFSSSLKTMVLFNTSGLAEGDMRAMQEEGMFKGITIYYTPWLLEEVKAYDW